MTRAVAPASATSLDVIGVTMGRSTTVACSWGDAWVRVTAIPLSEVHLAFANAERRVIVTHDNDYLRFHTPGMLHPGIAYCPPQTRSIGQIIEMLLLMT